MSGHWEPCCLSSRAVGFGVLLRVAGSSLEDVPGPSSQQWRGQLPTDPKTTLSRGWTTLGLCPAHEGSYELLSVS